MVRIDPAAPQSWPGEGGGGGEEGKPVADVAKLKGGPAACKPCGGEGGGVDGATTRTPALISQVLGFLPPPPDQRMALDLDAAEDEGKEEDPVALALTKRGMHRGLNPYFALWMFQLNECERQAWTNSPLKLHDAGLVAAINSLINWGPQLKDGYLDVTKAISNAIQLHPGPICCFRFDSSLFPPPEDLSRWIQVLAAKRVQMVILMNLTGPDTLEVPLHHLRSNRLTYLAVGFLSLRSCLPLALRAASLEGHAWSALTDLNLTACAFDGNDLSATVRDLQGLRHLFISFSLLTAGCPEVGLCIASPGLVSIQMFHCTADRPLMIGRAPALTRLSLGVAPAPSSACPTLPLQIKMEFCSVLSVLDYLDLQCHHLHINTDYVYRVNRCRVLGLYWLRTLGVTVEMASAHGIQALVSVLRFLPYLKKLTIQCRNGNIGCCDEEVCPSIEAAPCLAGSLHELMLLGFKGRIIEATFVAAVLKVARFLSSLTVELLPWTDDATGANLSCFPTCEDAVRYFRACHQVSRECRIDVLFSWHWHSLVSRAASLRSD